MSSADTRGKAGLPSRHVTEGADKALHRIFYYAMGLDTEAIHLPMVGVASSWSSSAGAGDVPLRAARWVEAGVAGQGATPRRFATIEAGDEPTLVARELIADSIELTVRGHSYDGLVTVAATADAMIAGLMAACRLDIPCAVLPVVGASHGSTQDDVAVALMLEEIGVAPPRASDSTRDIERVAEAAGALAARRIADRETVRMLLSRERLEFAASVLGALDAAPDLLLHLVSIAHEAGHAFDIDRAVERFTSAPDRWPAPTVALEADRLRKPDGAARATAHWGRTPLAPEGALWTGGGSPAFEGRARVFESEFDARRALENDRISRTDVVVIRGQGPRGGPGVRLLREFDGALGDHAGGSPAAVITDGRTRAGELGIPCLSLVAPESARGGPLANLGDGDLVRFDPSRCFADSIVPRTPTDGSTPPSPPEPVGRRVLAKYRDGVGPAHEGAVTHPGGTAPTRRYWA